MENFRLSDGAEASICGCILLCPETKETAAALISAEDFTEPFYGAIFSVAISEDDLDAVKLREKLKEKGHDLPDGFFKELGEVSILPHNLPLYCKLLRQDSQRRHLRLLASEMLMGITDDADPVDIAASFENRLRQIGEGAVGGKTLTTLNAINLFFDHRQRIDAGEGSVRTGFSPLDQMLSGGLLRSGLYILAARPGMGKTTFALQVADHIAQNMEQKGSVLFVSLEMSAEQLTGKRIARISGLPVNQVLLQKIDSEEEYKKIIDAAETLTHAKMEFNNCPSASVADIRRMARAIPDLQCIVVDYLGLITPSNRRSSKYEAVTDISRDLKQLAVKLNVPLLALAQLNRENTARADKRPQMSDLRDTGAIEQDADGIIMLHCDDYYTNNERPLKPYEGVQIEIFVRKNRFGPTGSCNALFFPATGRIIEDHSR